MSTYPSRSLTFTLRVASVLALRLPRLWLRLRFVTGDEEALDEVRRCARVVLRSAGCRVQVRNIERLPRTGNMMLVANHLSIADAAVLLGALPLDVRFVANHVYAEYPVLGAAIRAASANIVDRGSWRSRADSARAMVEALDRGQSLLVFPEGTTSDDGVMRPFRRGAFVAAARTGRPVVPIAIRGTAELVPPASYLLSNAAVTIDILPPIAARDATREGVADLAARAADAIRSSLASTSSSRSTP